jgi:hypothetical protein
MMKKRKQKGIFTTVIIYSVAVCFVSTLIALASGMFLYNVTFFMSEKNANQKKEFETSKKVLDTVDGQYVARFDANGSEAIKTKLAQQGLTSLLDSIHIRVLYGYDEIDRIVANQSTGPKTLSVVNPKGYNWPTIRLVSMMYTTTKCTTMVEFSGGENKSEQRRQIWKWEYKNGKWLPLAFSNYFIAKDVQISKQGISFVLSPRHDTKLAKVFVLNK